MGFQIEINWVLKLRREQGLDEGNLKIKETYEFLKEGYRIYPINVPIDLIDKNWSPVAKVAVTEFRNCSNQTSGKYRVLKIFQREEREFLRGYWDDVRRFLKDCQDGFR